jgi:NACHT domain
LKNIRGKVDEKVENYRTTLVRLREKFLAYAAVTSEATVLQMWDDAKIREIPYKGGWRFGDEKRCLPGTREDFLDYIINWIENPKSERVLVLLGQAGTGKSSIAHEIARRFENVCLGSYFAFLRKEHSKDEAYYLFTTLARDLSDHYPPFRLALGRAIKDDSSLRSSRDYPTLFERIILEPLKGLQVGGPILLIIDALDESGATMGKTGLTHFLLNVSSISHQTSGYSSHRGRRMVLNLLSPTHVPSVPFT